MRASLPGMTQTHDETVPVIDLPDEWVSLDAAVVHDAPKEIRAACEAWLKENGADGLTNRVVVPAMLRYSDRPWFGKVMFVVEVEPDGTSPYVAHVRSSMIRTTPPAQVRDLFRPSSCPIA